MAQNRLQPAAAPAPAQSRGWRAMLTEKRGPLPTWAWLAIGLGAVLLVMYIRSSRSSTGTSGVAVDTSTQSEIRPIFVAQQGPQGPAGATGATGPAGPAGPQGPPSEVPPDTPPPTPPADNGDNPNQHPTTPVVPATTAIKVGDWVTVRGIGKNDSYGGTPSTHTFSGTRMKVLRIVTGKNQTYPYSLSTDGKTPTGWFQLGALTRA